ncbi:extensin [Burkholderia sp. LAS2]|uniref:extensin n=1 Tax=Burkholderia sp. LAS2 TaxID=2813843 RepID=UPI001BCD9E69|nr:extensin [Burkholderia sp. LAS2]QVN11075.1 extensin [Burkholderia sp. LAS2]
MTSTRKTMMIAGGLLVAAAGTAYVMLLRADHRAIEDAGIADSAAPVAAASAGSDHAVQGAIAPPAPAAATVPKQAAVAAPTAPAAPTPAPAPTARAAAPAPAPPVPVVSDKPQLVTKPAAPPPKVNVVTVDAQDSTPSAPAPAAKSAQSMPPAQVTQRAPRKRDGLERHATAAPPAATKSETPETAALVRESAKLDPSLPPPSMSSISSMPASTGSYRQGSGSSGANPVAAAMTEQLVRQSSSFKSTAPAPADGGPSATK